MNPTAVYVDELWLHKSHLSAQSDIVIRQEYDYDERLRPTVVLIKGDGKL